MTRTNDEPAVLTWVSNQIKRAHEAGKAFTELETQTGIHHRTLSDLSKGKGHNAHLTFRQLHALNLLFINQGGLAVAFAQPDILNQIAEFGRVTVILGSQPDSEHERIDLSRWDIRALREIVQAMNDTGRVVQLSIEDVIARPEAEQHFGKNVKVAENESWYQALEDDGPSIVCIGSPKACAASEVMLARMFGYEEFGRWQDCDPRPPFFFVWPESDGRATSSPSVFRRTFNDLEKEGVSEAQIDKLREKRGRCCGYFDGTFHPIMRNCAEWDTYGLIAAQRRPGDQYWLVLAGVTGPGTLGAAKAVRDFAVHLPVDPHTKCSAVAWTTVTTRVRDNARLQSMDERGFRKDERRVWGKPEVGKVQTWVPGNSGARVN